MSGKRVHSPEQAGSSKVGPGDSKRATSAVDAHLDCPICLKTFNHADRKPKVISCGHSVCAACSEQLVKGNRISCPICRTRAVVPKDGLPTNFTLADIAESSAADKPLQVVCKDCGGTSDGVDAWMCRTKSKKMCSSADKDGVFLCAACCLKAHRKHNIVEVKDVLEEKRRATADWKDIVAAEDIGRQCRMADIEANIGMACLRKQDSELFHSVLATLEHQHNVLETRANAFWKTVGPVDDDNTLLKALAKSVDYIPPDQVQVQMEKNAAAESKVKAVSGKLLTAVKAFHVALEKTKAELDKLAAAHDFGDPPPPPVVPDSPPADLSRTDDSDDSDLSGDTDSDDAPPPVAHLINISAGSSLDDDEDDSGEDSDDEEDSDVESASEVNTTNPSLHNASANISSGDSDDEDEDDSGYLATPSQPTSTPLSDPETESE